MKTVFWSSIFLFVFTTASRFSVRDKILQKRHKKQNLDTVIVFFSHKANK